MKSDNWEEIQKQAASALAAGMEIASAANKRLQGDDGAQLGKLLATPTSFWAMAAGQQLVSGPATAEAMAAQLKLASAKLSAGDLEYVRESLLGQAAWLSVVATRLMNRADIELRNEEKRGATDRAQGWIRLALKAQTQAGAAVSSAAALNKLTAADAVEVPLV